MLPLCPNLNDNSPIPLDKSTVTGIVILFTPVEEKSNHDSCFPSLASGPLGAQSLNSIDPLVALPFNTSNSRYKYLYF